MRTEELVEEENKNKKKKIDETARKMNIFFEILHEVEQGLTEKNVKFKFESNAEMYKYVRERFEKETEPLPSP